MAQYQSCLDQHAGGTQPPCHATDVSLFCQLARGLTGPATAAHQPILHSSLDADGSDTIGSLRMKHADQIDLNCRECAQLLPAASCPFEISEKAKPLLREQDCAIQFKGRSVNE